MDDNRIKGDDNSKQEFVELPKETEESNQGGLDDTNLTDDFVIGKDFFIDSFEADKLAEDEVNPGRKKRKKKRMPKNGCLVSAVWMAVILVIALIAAFFLLFLGMDYLGVSMTSDATVDVEINIAEGAGAGQIAKQLKKAGIIDSTLFFRLYAKKGGYDSRFQSGIYYFCKQDSYEDIAEQLMAGGIKATEVKITVPEGWNVDKIAKRLEENGVCTAAQFKEAVNEATKEKYNYEFMSGIKTQIDGVHYRLEGYLFPDTYIFYTTNDKSGAEMAIRKMLANMDSKLTADMYTRAAELGYSMHDILTLASVIEMESSAADLADKQKVSAVFHNRLNDWDNPMLQSDPTKSYPYNQNRYDTYKITGLAPGAYCSPSVDSIKAALWPDEACNAYYFVTDKDMNFYYNETLKQHNSTINKLKKEGKWKSWKLK